MPVALLVAISVLDLLSPASCWSCLLQKDASFHEAARSVAVAPCMEDKEDRQQPEVHQTRDKKRDEKLAVLARSVHNRHDNAPAPAAAPSPAAPAAATGSGKGLPPKREKEKIDMSKAVRTELHLPTTIREIHDSSQGPLSHFLQVVHTEFCKALDMSPKRFSILGIRGEYTQLNAMLLDEGVVEGSKDFNLTVGFVDFKGLKDLGANPTTDAHAEHNAGAAAETGAKGSTEDKKDPAKSAADHEVVVDIEILPGSTEADPAPLGVFSKMKGLLENVNGPLMAGPLGKHLKGATIELGAKPTEKDSNEQTAHGHTTHVMPSSLLLLVLYLLSGVQSLQNL